jgi:hypothetical protein
MPQINPSWLVNQAPGNLKAQIRIAVEKGYHVVGQTSTTAQLVKEKKFSLFWAVLWTFVALIGLLVYLFWYMSRKNAVIYLDLETQPRIGTA